MERTRPFFDIIQINGQLIEEVSKHQRHCRQQGIQAER